MSRQTKAGLDYFELDCHMDEKVKLIEAEFGLKGFAIVVKLYQHIYSGFGYYCEWNPEISVLWAYRLGCTHGVAPRLGQGNVGSMSESGALPGFPKNLINEIVAASIRRNIFSKELFQRYHILTSSGIQRRYLNAVSKREKVELKKEYLLISDGKNEKNVLENEVFTENFPINGCDGTQSKGNNNNISCAPEPHDKAEEQLKQEEQLRHDFEIIYAIYPKKVGKTVAFANYKQWVSKKGKDVSGTKYHLTNRQIYMAVQKYVILQKRDGKDMQYWKNFDTLMGRQLLDYVEWGSEK